MQTSLIYSSKVSLTYFIDFSHDMFPFSLHCAVTVKWLFNWFLHAICSLSATLGKLKNSVNAILMIHSIDSKPDK